MISKAILYLSSMLISSVCIGQEYITVSGVVQDATTSQPLPFSTISIKNEPVGVVTNSEGRFDFTFDVKYAGDTIVISRAGYLLKKLPASGLSNQVPIKIELHRNAMVLEEIVIRDKPLTAEEIIGLVRDNIKKNYPTKPFELEGFYRDYKIENDKCIGLIEAAVSIYDKGYTGKTTSFHLLKEKVTLKQVRKSLAVTFQSHVFNDMNIMKGLLRLNDMRYVSRALNKRNRRSYRYELDGFTTINNRLMYKVKAEDDWVFTFYVDMETFAVPKIEMNFEWQDNIAENEWVRDDSIRYEQRRAIEILDFQSINGLLYPKYHTFTSDLHAFDKLSGEPLFTSVLRQQYMVTNIDTHPDDKPEKRELMDDGLMLEKQAYDYDPEFWENYNVLKLNAQDQQLVKDLERDISLNEQYEQSVVEVKKKGRKR